MVQDKFESGMYVVDRDFRIVSVNRRMAELYPEVKIGDVCYRSIALREEQCDVCPLKTDNALFYNPVRREWIYANAAAMDYPGHGACYHVQFQLRQRIKETGQEILQDENMDEHIRELSGGNPDACAIGGYCEPGYPLSYVNDSLLRLLGYAGVEDLSADIDGLVNNTIHPDDVERVTRDLTRCAQHGGTFETTYRMRRRNNTWFWVVSRSKRVEMHDGLFVLLAVISDMTEFVKHQSELRAQNEKLLQQEFASQSMLEHMPGGYHRCAAEPGFPFLYFGTSFEEITGWSRAEIEGEFGNLFANLVLPEDIPICSGIVTNVEKTGYSNAIYRLKRKGGGHIWVSDSTMRVEIGDAYFYHGVLADVTEQIEALEQARREAEASNMAKSAFLFNASHDIRTPMNAIQGFAHIIEQNAESPAIVRETVAKLKRSGNVLLMLMNDILELSRIERGKETINLTPLHMAEHAEKLNEMLSAEMQEKGINFRMENEIVHPQVMADEIKLSRIAMNLLSNAKKFTPAGGTVTFGVRECDCDGKQATYTLFVRDTGIGMSEEFRRRAFEQFERERSSTVSGVSGSGLGLAIVKKLSDLLGGSCIIESELGRGTEITCSIPLALAAAEDFKPELLPTDVDFTGRRVLLVEDNEFNREIARYVFEMVGFAVEEAENGVECLTRINAVPAGYYDFILMDIQMPIMDGYTAAKEIRRHHDPVIARMPIIAMTANAFDEDRRRCLEVGMDGHIGKPLEAKVVLRELMRVLREHFPHREGNV